MRGSDFATAGANEKAFANAKYTIERGGQYIVNRVPSGTEAAAGKSRILLTESYLRTEMPLNPNSTTYNFGILNNQITNGSSGLYPTERRITLQDVFFTYAVGFYVTMNSTSAGNTSYQYQLMTFPNPQFYLSGGIDLNLMQALWNTGEIQLTINGNVVTPGWDLKKHMAINQTQIDTATWPAGPFFNQVNQLNDGMVQVEPNWIFNGGNNIQLDVVYRVPLTGIGIGNTAQMRLVLIMQGFLAQNASSIMDAKQ